MSSHQPTTIDEEALRLEKLDRIEFGYKYTMKPMVTVSDMHSWPHPDGPLTHSTHTRRPDPPRVVPAQRVAYDIGHDAPLLAINIGDARTKFFDFTAPQVRAHAFKRAEYAHAVLRRIEASGQAGLQLWHDSLPKHHLPWLIETHSVFEHPTMQSRFDLLKPAKEPDYFAEMTQMAIVADVIAERTDRQGAAPLVLHITHADEFGPYQHIVQGSVRPIRIGAYVTRTSTIASTTDIARMFLAPALGGCMAAFQPNVVTRYIIYIMVPAARRTHALQHNKGNFSHMEGASEYDQQQMILDHQVFYGYAVHTGQCTPATLRLVLHDYARKHNGLYMAGTAMLPEMLCGGRLGFHGSLAGTNDKPVVQREDPSALGVDVGQRCNLKVAQFTQTDAYRATTERIARISSAYDGRILAFTIKGHSAERTIRLTCVTNEGKEIETQTHLTQVKLGRPTSFTKWGSHLAPTHVEVQLAPAFAALSGSWLDRNMITALTAGANWAGGSRIAEVEPHVRAAIRQASNSPIELTRIYVRLWAIAVDAAAAASDADKAFVPTTTFTNPQPVKHVRSYNDWAAGLVGATTGAAPALYHDDAAASACSDVLPMLTLAVAAQIQGSPTAEWLWPPIHNISVHTNATYSTGLNTPVYYANVVGTINWLACSTNTLVQAHQARNLVMALAYRKAGTSLFGLTQAAQQETISLPEVHTAGQYLQPLSLWATTTYQDDAGAFDLAKPNSMLREAATLSLRYQYLMAAAARFAATPSWWGRALARHMKHDRQRLNQRTPTAWRLLVVATNIGQTTGIGSLPAVLHSVLPHHTQTPNTIAASSSVTIHDILDAETTVHSADPLAYMISKVQIKAPTQVRLNAPIRMTSIAPMESMAHAATILHKAGLEVGYVAVDKAFGTYTSMHQCPKTYSGPAEIPDAMLKHHKLVPYVVIPQLTSLLMAQALAVSRSAASWYLETQMLPHEEPEYLHDDIDDGHEPNVFDTGRTTDQPTTGTPTPVPSSSTDEQEKPVQEPRLSITPPEGKVEAVSDQKDILEGDQLLMAMHGEMVAGQGYKTPATMKYQLTEWAPVAAKASDNAYLDAAAGVIETFKAAHPRYVDEDTGVKALNKISEHRKLNAMRSISPSEQVFQAASPTTLVDNTTCVGPASQVTSGTLGDVQAPTTSTMTGHAPNVKDWPTLEIARLS